MNVEYKILTKEDARGKFIDLFDEFIIPERHGADRLLQWLDNETDFFRAGLDPFSRGVRKRAVQPQSRRI